MIEGIVRPFQSPQVTQSGLIPVPSVGPVTPASLRWGAVGNLSSSGVSFKACQQQKYSEVSRQTDTVRVTNPQDSSQYVDVQRTKSLKMKPGGGDSNLGYQPFSDVAAGVQADLGAWSQFMSQFDSCTLQDGSDGSTSFLFNPPS